MAVCFFALAVAACLLFKNMSLQCEHGSNVVSTWIVVPTNITLLCAEYLPTVMYFAVYTHERILGHQRARARARAVC